MFHTFGLSAIGIGFVERIISISRCKYVIDGVAGNGALTTYLQNKGLNVLSFNNYDETSSESIYQTLREYDFNCSRSTKKLYKYETLILNWPDISGREVTMIKRFKSNYLCLIFDLEGISGSSELHNFLQNYTDFFNESNISKYTTIYKCERFCTHFQSGLTCNVIGAILKRTYLENEIQQFENYKSLLLFSPRLSNVE